MTARSPTSDILPASTDAAVAIADAPAADLPGPAVVRSVTARPMGSRTLRAWFAVYLLWLVALTAGAVVCLQASRQGVSAALPLWLACLGTFYLSLANGLLPLPTMWMIMLLASDAVGLPGSPLMRVAMVATITALATGMANLNEYHILHWALGSRTAGKVTNTRLVQWAIRWFRVSPFWILTMAALVPIPIDAIRWVAIADSYNRLRFFWAYALGRWVRYAVLAGATIWLHAGVRTIIVTQVALIVVAAAPVVAKMMRQRH
jgi:membrane protein YqaA with SNARE-associated domain